MTLPPGQIETLRFPVVGERVSSLARADEWQMWVQGVRWSLDELMSLSHRDVTFDIHCVTGWTRLHSTFTGVPLAEIADPEPGAAYVSFASHSNRDHHTSLPVPCAMEHSWVVHSIDDEPLSVEHGGPVRVVTPGKYFYKSVKWLKSVSFLEEDRLGWWETNSFYHNNADPFAGDQRFTTGSVRPDQLRRFLTAASYEKYRSRVLLGLDLREWRPSSTELSRLYLKNCDLSGVDLSGVDLRASNLSLSRLRDADLSHADLSGSDLEGADFGGADLTGADLSGTALSATRFEGADVGGANFDGSWGLVESQRNYLAGRGVAL